MLNPGGFAGSNSMCFCSLFSKGSGKSSLIRLLTRQDYPVHREDGMPSLKILGRERWEVFELPVELRRSGSYLVAAVPGSGYTSND
jgi:hypothetical protein